jgi:hypothetical protein
MRLSKDPKKRGGGPKMKFHAQVTHHPNNSPTHHIGSYASAEECKAAMASKYPDAHNISVKSV